MKKLILIFGGPASGKGTLGRKLAAHYNFEHISAGSLIRSKSQENSPLGQRI